MSSFINNEQERSLIKWGGVSGILGGVFFVLAFFFVLIFLANDPETLYGWVTRFPEIQNLRVIENLLYLTGLLFVVPLFISLYRVLKDSHLPAALYGSAFSLIGISSMIIFATPHVAHSKLSKVEQAIELSANEMESIALMWQSVWGVFDTGLYIGFIVVPLGFILMGAAMYKSTAYGRCYAITSQILGALGLVSGIIQIVDTSSPMGAISYFMIIFYSFIFGIKNNKLAKA